MMTTECCGTVRCTCPAQILLLRRGPALCDYIVAGSDCQVTFGPWEWSSVAHCGALFQPRYYYYVVGPALCDYIAAGSDCQVAFGPWEFIASCVEGHLSTPKSWGCLVFVNQDRYFFK